MPPLPPVTYVTHPSIMDETGAFQTLRVHLKKILENWRGSLFSFEWLHPDGTLKTRAELGPRQREQREQVEQQIHNRKPLCRPVLGIGVLECVEIGAGRDTLLTLAASGGEIIEVDVPLSMVQDFQKFVVTERDRGSVMFYVLLALVMIAALSFAVMRSSGTAVTSLSDSRASILADELIHTADTLKNAVARLQLRGCTETQLSFENAVVSGYTNASAPGDKSCHLYDPAGGGITFTTPTTDANDGSAWLFAGGPVVHQSGGYASTLVDDNADLVMMLLNVNPAVCAAINDKLGIGGIPVDDGDYSNMTKFTGVYAATEDINGNSGAAQPSPCIGAVASPNLCGMESGCYREETAGQRYIYYQVLLQR